MTKEQTMARLRRMNPAQLYLFGVNMYKTGYMDGLREGEKEFDDAVILTEEEARERMPEDVAERILSGR